MKKDDLIGIVMVAAIVALVALISWAVWAACTTVEKIGTVEMPMWRNRIEREQFKTVEDEGWSVPISGRLKWTESRIHHHDRIRTGTDSEGRPRYTSSARYQTFYHYDIDRWVAIQPIETWGAQDKEQIWPDESAHCGLRQLGNIRSARRITSYRVRINTGDDLHQFDGIAEGKWWTVRQGDTAKVRINKFGIVLSWEKYDTRLESEPMPLAKLHPSR